MAAGLGAVMQQQLMAKSEWLQSVCERNLRLIHTGGRGTHLTRKPSRRRNAAGRKAVCQSTKGRDLPRKKPYETWRG